MGRRTPIDRLAAIAEHINRLQHDREVAICEALDAGASWPAIATALGVSTQAAHKRFRWLRHNAATGETWYEPPLPITPKSPPTSRSRR